MGNHFDSRCVCVCICACVRRGPLVMCLYFVNVVHEIDFSWAHVISTYCCSLRKHLPGTYIMPCTTLNTKDTEMNEAQPVFKDCSLRI